ncbi:hypothetical protein EUGRSUZ_C00459 [Eucalyptus grandis]|uniref:Uncharacterized protein n=2 Tax=Eucalyptus grandis TaxID=71139 RepID=A0ACC3L9J9_EUCGR|nr:hypothetical protein EUGRSUZ_C00459 [Eucalyptus grandis]
MSACTTLLLETRNHGTGPGCFWCLFVSILSFFNMYFASRLLIAFIVGFVFLFMLCVLGNKEISMFLSSLRLY